VLVYFWLICSGLGVFSVDYWLAGKLLGDRSTKCLVLELELRAQRLLETQTCSHPNHGYEAK
jgi:hypothetical protein